MIEIKNFVEFWAIRRERLSSLDYKRVKIYKIRRRGVVGRVPDFQPRGPGSITDRARNLNSYPRIGCVLCVLSCAVLGGGSDILLTTHSVRPALLYLV